MSPLVKSVFSSRSQCCPNGASRVSVVHVAALCVFVLSLALAGCGKRNAPTPPPDEPNTYPRPYPSE
jgi:hypothetical protein